MTQEGTFYKVVFLGDGGVGKTNLIGRQRHGDFERKYIATLGVEVTPLSFRVRDYETGEQKTVTLNVWDCAGQEKFMMLTKGYCNGAHAGVIVFDVTSRKTFENIESWKGYLRTDIPVVYCANKIDVDPAKRRVRQEEVDPDTIPVSAKTNFNQEKLWLGLIRKLENNDSLCTDWE